MARGTAVERIGEGSSCLTQGTEQAIWTSAPFASFIGLLVGLILSFVGFIAAGLGHGSYVIIGLVSSPLGTFGNVLIALFGGASSLGIVCILGRNGRSAKQPTIVSDPYGTSLFDAHSNLE